MYYFLGIFIGIAILFVFLNFFRIRSIRKKVCALSDLEKNQLLNALIEPVGFAYDPCKDLFTSRMDAWQREFGYCALYDNAAPHVQLVFHCEPFYFNAYGRTWLLEIWKGQYGINTGAEIGLYCTDEIISPSDYETALFHAVEDSRMPGFSLELWQKDELLFQRRAKHWWLTGFLMGRFSSPAELSLKATIHFGDCEMLEGFLRALDKQGYSPASYSVNCTSVTLLFQDPFTKQPCERFPFTCRFSQWKNKLFCRLFVWITRPFCTGVDRLLYLYYFLPFAFRRTVQVCKPRRYKTRRKKTRKRRA